MYPTYTYYPRCQRAPDWVDQLTAIFTIHRAAIDSTAGSNISNEVLRVLRPGLLAAGFEVEDGKASEGQLARPVFFGENGAPSRQYKIDAYHPMLRIALEVEAGRAQAGNAIYRDIVQMALLVDVDYAAVAVPLAYRYDSGGRTRPTEPYRHCASILDAIYGGRRLELPFTGFLLIGY
jgi:hypothetical protein